jgi:hypothetical protein
MANKLCIHCKHCLSDALFGEHYCYYPAFLSEVDASPCLCRHARQDMYRCPNGCKWEAKPVEIKVPPMPWWKRLFY